LIKQNFEICSRSFSVSISMGLGADKPKTGDPYDGKSEFSQLRNQI
jgi:hypothetical protein